MPPRIDTRLLFPNAKGTHTNLHSFRSRDWTPAVEAAGLEGRRIYDLRHSFASYALAAGIGKDAARAKLDAYQERFGQDRATEAEAQE